MAFLKEIITSEYSNVSPAGHHFVLYHVLCMCLGRGTSERVVIKGEEKRDGGDRGRGR